MVRTSACLSSACFGRASRPVCRACAERRRGDAVSCMGSKSVYVRCRFVYIRCKSFPHGARGDGGFRLRPGVCGLAPFAQGQSLSWANMRIFAKVVIYTQAAAIFLDICAILREIRLWTPFPAVPVRGMPCPGVWACRSRPCAPAPVSPPCGTDASGIRFHAFMSYINSF